MNPTGRRVKHWFDPRLGRQSVALSPPRSRPIVGLREPWSGPRTGYCTGVVSGFPFSATKTTWSFTGVLPLLMPWWI
jgi:hypothetical protein